MVLSSDALVLQNVSGSEHGSSSLGDAILLHDMDPTKMRDVTSGAPCGDHMQRLKLGHLGQGNASACSSSSGGAEVQSYLKDKDLPCVGTMPNPKTKPTDVSRGNCSMARVKGQGQSGCGDSPEISSGSERVGGSSKTKVKPPPRKPPPRSLRKTKSRGKGKGSRHFNPIILDNAAFDNQAYSSDSDGGGVGGGNGGGVSAGSKHKHLRLGITHKECWS